MTKIQKSFNAWLKINYFNGGELCDTVILTKPCDTFSEALAECRAFHNGAGVEFGGCYVTDADNNTVYKCDGEEFFIAYHASDDYGEVVWNARGNSKNLIRI